MASRRFFTFGLVSSRRAVGTALTRDDVPLAFGVEVVVAVIGVGVHELATRVASVGVRVVFAERLVTALSGSESRAISLANRELSGRTSNPSATLTGLLGAIARLFELTAALGAGAVDVHAVSLSRASGDILDGTTEFSAGVANEVAVDVRRAVGLASVAAALDARVRSVLAHVVGRASLSSSQGRASFLADLVGFRPHASRVRIAGGLRSVGEGALLSTLSSGTVDVALFVTSASIVGNLERALTRACAGGDIPLADGDVQATNTVSLLFARSGTDVTRVVEGASVVSIAGSSISAVHLEASLTAGLVGFVVTAHVSFDGTLGRGELITRSLASLSGLIPHAFTRNGVATSSVGVLLDARSCASRSNKLAVGVTLAVSFRTTSAVLLASSSSGRPFATRVSITSSGVSEGGRARLFAGGGSLVPAADGSSLARVDGEKLVAGRVAHGAIDRPSAGTLRSVLARRLGSVAELTLGSAVSINHLAHGLVEAGGGVSGVGSARVNTLLSGSIPHAVVISIAASSGGVGATALRTARLSFGVPTALFRSRALGESGESGAERLATSSVGVVLAIAASITISLRSSVGARSCASRTSPDASIVGVAARAVRVSELALSGALTTRPLAHLIFLASSFGRGTAASRAAFTRGRIPHTRVGVHALVLLQGIALTVAAVGVSDPFARRIGRARVLISGGRASRVTSLGDSVEVAARSGAGLSSGVDGRASRSASVTRPIAKSGLFAFSLVGVNDNAQLRADLEISVPLAVGILVARSLDGVASRALLFAASSGVDAAQVVGGASSSRQARASISAASVDGVPHTFRIDVALSLVRVAVDTLESALGFRARSTPVARRIVLARSLGELVLTFLAAEVALGVPSAHGLSSARTSVGVVRASLFASRFVAVPHASSVSITSSLSGVLSRALAVTRTVVGIVDAHDLFLLTFRRLEFRAGFLALTDGGVEHTFSFSSTAFGGEAGRFALGGTRGSVGVEFASRISSASSLRSISTRAHTLSSSFGVSTSRVSIASISGGVAVSTLSGTFFGVAIPHAHTVAGTVTIVVSDFALATALVTESIPLATIVGVTSGLSSVRFNTLGDAAERRGVFAERRNIAGSSSVGFTSFEGEASARSLAEFSTLVPHAVLVRVAAVDGGVFNNAGLDALLSGVGSVTTETSRTESATSLAESGALRVGHFRALDDTLSSVPVAFGVDDATTLGEDLSAGRFADGINRIPLAINGVSSARSGVGTVAVAAAEIALTRSIREDAHTRFSTAVSSRAHTPAGLLASRLSRIPHAAVVVQEAGSLAVERTVLSTVRAGSGGRSVGDRAEGSGRALVVGFLRRNGGSSDGLGTVILALFEGRVVRAEGVTVTLTRSVVLESAAECASSFSPLASRIVFTNSLVVVSCANTLTLVAFRVPAAERIGIAITLSGVAEEAALAAVSSRFEDAHEGFGGAFGVREEPARLLANRLNRIPHGVVHGVVVTFGLLGEALRRLGDAAEGRIHVRESFSNAARRFCGTLFRSHEFLTVSVAEVESGVPLAERIRTTGSLSEGVVTSLGAVSSDSIPLTFRARFTVGFTSGSRSGNITASRAGASTSVPLADTRVGHASSVGGGAVASINTATGAGVPDAVDISVTSFSSRVSARALGGAGGAIPVADSSLRALIRWESRARLRASTISGVPSARGVGDTVILSEVSVFALLLADVGSGDPAAARLFSAGGGTSDETAGSLASRLLSIPLAVDIIDARTRRGVLISALHVAVIKLPHAHGFTDASILDLISSVARHGHCGVNITATAALLRRGVPHAVGVTITSNGGGVLDTARSEATSETRGSVDEHATRVGNAVGRSSRDGDGFAGVDAVSSNPGAVRVSSALILRLNLSAVSQALSINPLAALLRTTGRFITRVVLATSAASTLRGVPFAEFLVSFTSSFSSTIFATGDALSSHGVDGATIVILAVFEVGSVSGGATFLARTVLVAAFSCGIADGFSLTTALRRAVVGVSVPSADGGRSGAGSGVAASTRSLACTFSEITSSSGFAVILGGDDVTVGAASLSVDVPLALVTVGFASSLGAVLVLALGTALVVGSDFTLSLSCAIRSGASFARSNTSTSFGGVHALRVFVTLISSSVTDEAASLASHFTRTKRSFSPDAVSVSSAISLSGASRASLLASIRSSLPHAHVVVGIAGSLSTDGGAGSLASLTVPHAESVGEALHLSGVDVHALAATSVVGSPSTQGVGLAVTLTIDASTVLFAHTTILVPDAARVFRAVFLVVVERRASFKAGVLDAIPAAALVVVAGGFHLIDIARLSTSSRVGVPLAVAVSLARFLASVSGGTLGVALSRSGVEGADGGSLAVSGDESVASRSASLVSTVPSTSLVRQASVGGDVGVLTTLGALVGHGS